MGRVYLAEHTLLGRMVALKKLRSELAGDRRVVRRFFSEARAANRIAHENIVEVTDLVESADDGCYFIMELLEGEALVDACPDTGLPVLRAVEIGVQIASGLQAVHEAGIVHRDLKPENIFLARRKDGSDLVKLLDFGVARVTGELSRVSVHDTQRGTVLGTPCYMAPEQARGGLVDPRSDVYSFGVILFEMLTGRLPYDADTFSELVVMHACNPIPAPGECCTKPIPAGLGQLVVACMQKDPADRPGSMADLELELRSIECQIKMVGLQLRDRVGGGAPRELTDYQRALAPASPAPHVAPAPPHRADRSRPFSIMALSLIVVAVLFGVYWATITPTTQSLFANPVEDQRTMESALPEGPRSKAGVAVTEPPPQPKAAAESPRHGEPVKTDTAPARARTRSGKVRRRRARKRVRRVRKPRRARRHRHRRAKRARPARRSYRDARARRDKRAHRN